MTVYFLRWATHRSSGLWSRSYRERFQKTTDHTQTTALLPADFTGGGLHRQRKRTGPHCTSGSVLTHWGLTFVLSPALIRSENHVMPLSEQGVSERKQHVLWCECFPQPHPDSLQRVTEGNGDLSLSLRWVMLTLKNMWPYVTNLTFNPLMQHAQFCKCSRPPNVCLFVPVLCTVNRWRTLSLKEKQFPRNQSVTVSLQQCLSTERQNNAVFFNTFVTVRTGNWTWSVLIHKTRHDLSNVIIPFSNRTLIFFFRVHWVQSWDILPGVPLTGPQVTCPLSADIRPKQLTLTCDPGETVDNVVGFKLKVWHITMNTQIQVQGTFALH